MNISSARRILHRLALAGWLIPLAGTAYPQIAAWQFSSPASSGNEATYAATTLDPNMAPSTLSRGTGISPTSLGRGFSANTWNSTSQAAAIANDEYFQFTLEATTGYQVSLSTIDAKMRRSSSGPNAYIWQYSVDGTTFNDIGAVVPFTTAATDGTVQSTINLSGIAALQAVESGTSIILRLYAWGASAESGTFAFGRYDSGITTNSLAIGGTVEPATGTPGVTSVSFDGSAASVSEGSGTANLTLNITNPSGTNATSVDVVLASGDAARIGNYTTQTVTWAAGDGDPKTVALAITDNAACDGDASLSFSLQNITGGDEAEAGANDAFVLTVEDNETAADPTATAASAIGENGFTANWDAVNGATGYFLDVSTSPTFGTTTPATDLFFSEYVEGSSNNKYIEIYNGTGAPVDLSLYTLELYANGATAANNSVALSGTLADQATIVFKNSNATIYSGGANSAVCNFNGDDAIALVRTGSGAFVDIIGRIGEDPGSSWVSGGTSTVDHTLVRKSTVSGGVTSNPASGFPTLATEWDSYAIDDISHLGAHNYADFSPSFVPGYENLPVAGTSQAVTGLDPLTTYYYRVRSAGGCSTGENSNVVEVATEAGTAPVLSAGTLDEFGDLCLNESSTPGSFTLEGGNLDNSDVAVGPLDGFTFSTSETGSYTASLSIAQPGGSFSQEIWVVFTPAAEQAYDGEIPVSGGGAPAIGVAAAGSGLNTAATVSTGSASATSSADATAGGLITDTGCSAASAYGIEFSTTAGFVPGSGTQVPAPDLAGGSFTSALSGLAACTVYYYRAYATNAGGTAYGEEESFTSGPMDAPVATAASGIAQDGFTATWDAVPGATGYRLDVSTSPTFGSTVAPGSTTTETFTAIGGGTGSSYITRTWTGDDGVEWSAYKARTDQEVFPGNDAITLRDESGSYLLSGAIAGGVTSIRFDVMQVFSGDDGNLTVSVLSGPGFATSTPIGSIAYTSSASVFDETFAPIAGPVMIRVDNNAEARPAIDNLAFTRAEEFIPSYVPGYADLAVSGTSQAVTGLGTNTTYYYRLRAETASCTSANSNTIAVTTLACTGNSFIVAIQTDGNGDQTTWEVLDESNNTVASGGPYTGQNNTLITESVCLDGAPGSACYSLRIYDSFGDGLGGTGSWAVLSRNGGMLLRDKFNTGYRTPSFSPLSPSYGDGHSFCLPPGPAYIPESECGIFNNQGGNKVYSSKVSGATQYQFEFSDPDAGRIRRIVRTTNYVHFNDMVVSPLSPGVKYFVRVRTNVAGPVTEAHFGTGCETGLAPNVPCSELIHAPAYGHSCNETRTFNTNNSFIYAKPVPAATEYQFHIYNTDEGYDQTFVRSTYILQLKWNTNVAPPLVDGATYNVEVQVKWSGYYSGFCPSSCTITIDNSGTSGFAGLQEQLPAAATLWPNPVRDGQVNLSLTGLEDAQQRITVDVQDIYGKQVYGREFTNEAERFSTVLQLPGSVASGVYMVRITVNGKSTVQRLSVIR